MPGYTAGFNAHGQLSRADNPPPTPSSSAWSTGRTDVTRVHIVLWSAVVFETSAGLFHAGVSSCVPSDCAEAVVPLRLPSAAQSHDDSTAQNDSAVKHFFGDESGLLGLVARDGSIFQCRWEASPAAAAAAAAAATKAVIVFERLRLESVAGVAIAGNEQVCVCDTSTHNLLAVQVWSSFDGLRAGQDPVVEHHVELEDETGETGVVSVQAAATAFAIHLRRHSASTSRSGAVDRIFTFGSALQPALLGRVPSAATPAATPSPVPFFEGLPSQVTKLVTAAGGGSWCFAALTADHDLYIWGGRRGQETSQVAQFRGSGGEGESVTLVEITDDTKVKVEGSTAVGVDIVDVAVGYSHVLVLTSTGDIWGCGDNEMGQLGGGGSKFATEWTRVQGPWSQTNGLVVDAIAAGGWSSFVSTAPG